MVSRLLADIDHVEEAGAELSRRIEERLAPFAAAVERLITIPGVQRCTAEVMVAEIGADMSRFPSAARLSSWACTGPRNHESAGKAPQRQNLPRQSLDTHRAGGSRWCRRPHQATYCPSRTLSSPARTVGHGRAVLAVGRNILEIALPPA